MALVQELNTKARQGGSGDFSALVVEYVEVLACIDDGEVLAALDDHGDRVTYINSVWSLPILRGNIVDVDASSCGHNHEAKLDAHVDNSLGIVKHFVKLVEVVNHSDLLVLVQHCLNVVPVQFAVNDVAERHCTTATGTGENSTIV